MIRWFGVLLLSSMLGISMLLQIFAINQQYSCHPISNANCDNVYNSCEIFFINQTNKQDCCPHIQCFCEDYSKYNFYCNFMYIDHTTFDKRFYITVMAGLLLTIATTSSIFYMRRYLLVRMGLTREDILAIDSSTRGFRNKFPEEKDQFLTAKHVLLLYNQETTTENNIRIRAIDFFGRKTFHFISMIIFTYFPIIILEGSPLPSYSGIVLYSMMELMCACLVINYIYIPKTKRKYIAPILFGGHNRIQDGTAALTNITTALFTGSIRTLVTAAGYLYIQKDTLLEFGKQHYGEYESIRKLFFLCWILNNNGVAFGDTAGEGVGAFLGKHRFKVYGFSGQENERSIEGCIGVFLFTALSDIIAIWSCSNLLNIYTWETITLISILCLTTTLFEMISFKGTDNIFICLSNELTIYLWLVWITTGFEDW